jgi:hypothetical protein
VTTSKNAETKLRKLMALPPCQVNGTRHYDGEPNCTAPILVVNKKVHLQRNLWASSCFVFRSKLLIKNHLM